MIRDLVRISVDMVKQEKIEEIREKAKSNVEEKVLDLLLPPSRRRENALAEGDYDRFLETREKLRKQLRAGILDDRLVDMGQVARLAVERVEHTGIIFLDEVDKIAGHESGHGPEVSREGVQRDLLPIIEG